MMESLLGTAGNPMLNILQKNNLVNVIAVVTRYFGGILLGTGGLVRAYSDSLKEAIQKSKIVQKCEGIEMLILLDYNEYNNFVYYCKKNNILITNVEYDNIIKCKIELEEEKKEKLNKDFEAKNIILKDVKEINKKYITKSI